MFCLQIPFNPHIQDGYEQSESQCETAPRGKQSAVREEPAIQDHIRGNVSTFVCVFASWLGTDWFLNSD